MGDDKPQQYAYPPPNYIQQQPQQPASGQAQGGGAVKTFFPISNSDRFFRV